MSKCFASRLGAGLMPVVVALFALTAPIGAEASVSGPDRQAGPKRSLVMCAALYGPRRDLMQNRCDSLPEVPRRPARQMNAVSSATPGTWRDGAPVAVSQTDVTKEVLE